MTNTEEVTQKLTAMDAALDALAELPSAGGTETDDLMAYLERWGRIKKATTFEAVAAIEEELGTHRGVTWRTIDAALGDKPGNANQRHNKRLAAAEETAPEGMPGKTVSEVAEELGVTSVPIYGRIKRTGPADWWGSFTRSKDGRVVRIKDFHRKGDGEIRILDVAAYKAAAGKPGRKPRNVAALTNETKD